MKTTKLTTAEALLLAVFAAHPLLVPGTKVEESFTLHAVRDMLVHGWGDADALDKWDHLEFAGAVPRSFVPPLLLSAARWSPLSVASQLGLVTDGVAAQTTIRVALALLSASSIIFFSRRLSAAYGAKVAKYFLLLQATSFHVPFWAGRTIPNMLAFPLVQFAFGVLVTPPAISDNSASTRRSTKRNLAAALSLLAITAVIFRLELVTLLVPFALEHLIRGTLSLTDLFVPGLASTGAALAVSSALDTKLWRSPTWLWPEGHAAWFNVVLGKSSEWGVEPLLFYFFPTLPRLLHLALPFALFSLAIDRRTRRLLWPCIAFVALMSALKHKEWRFVVYVVPPFFASAAAGIVALGSLTSSPRLRRLALLAVVALNLFTTLLGLAASSSNYPGLAAVRALEAHLTPSPSAPTSPGTAQPIPLPGGVAAQAAVLRVWVGIEAKMKGASDFALFDAPLSTRRDEAWYLSRSAAGLRGPAFVEYSKSEAGSLVDHTREGEGEGGLYAALQRQRFDYAIVDADALTPGAEIVFQASEFGGIDWTELVKGQVRSWEGLVGKKRRESVRVIKVERA
ncbi:hypothetical protein JCM10207_003649 [Rhodosporidiobolus poonsookiae]